MSIQSINRALDILEAIARRDEPVGITELSRELGLPVSTTHNLVRTLVNRGYVVHVRPRKGYLLGSIISELASGGHPVALIREVASDVLQWLLQAVDNESCYLAHYVRDTVVPIIQCCSTRWLGLGPIGEDKTLHATALGKIFLASRSREYVEQWVRIHGLPRLTKRTIVTLEQLLAELAVVRTRGYATNFGENHVGCAVIAVPVQLAGGQLLGLACAIPEARFEESKLPSLVALLKDAAAKVTAKVNEALGIDGDD